MYTAQCKHLNNKLPAAWHNEPIERLRVERSVRYLACSRSERNFSIFPLHNSVSNYNYCRSKNIHSDACQPRECKVTLQSFKPFVHHVFDELNIHSLLTFIDKQFHIGNHSRNRRECGDEICTRA